MTQHQLVLERPLGGAGPGLTARCTAGFYCPEEGALVPPSLQGLSSQLPAGLCSQPPGQPGGIWEPFPPFLLPGSLIRFSLILPKLCTYLIFISRPTGPAPPCASAPPWTLHLSPSLHTCALLHSILAKRLLENPPASLAF